MATKTRKTRVSKAERNSAEEISINESDDDIITSSTVRRSVTVRGTEKPTASSTPASKSRTERSSSPLHIERHEEKEELAHLNDRLAYYIDYVRSLETSKEKLTKKIQSMSKVETFEYDKLKDNYEDELRSLRRMVDDLAKEKASLEIALKSAKEEALNQKRKAERKEAEVSGLQRKIDSLERELSKQRSDSERYSSLLLQHDTLEKRCAKLSKDLDAEILLRTDLENRNVTLKEQMEFNERIFREERSKLKETHVVLEEEIEDRTKAEYESRLADELRQIREETAEEFEAYKLEFEDSFMIRLNEMKKSQVSPDSERKMRDDMYMYKMKSQKTEQELAAKCAEVDLLNRRISELESLMSLERKGFEDQLISLRQETQHLREELEHRLQEFTNLMSTKIALDQEILMYRKLLEGEESRCNLKVKSAGDTSFSFLSGSAGVKRRKVGDSYVPVDAGTSVSCGRESFRVDTSSKGEIEFTSKPDCTGKFVKLVNKSDKDVCVGGWTLSYKADNMETTYKFHHNLHIKGNSECTVWSSDTNETHNPPFDLVMKGQRFFSGNKVEMTLTSTDDLEMARCVMSKESTRSTGFNYNRKIASRSVRDSNSKNCTVM